MWPDVALYLWSLAPRLAPQHIIRSADTRTLRSPDRAEPSLIPLPIVRTDHVGMASPFATSDSG